MIRSFTGLCCTTTWARADFAPIVTVMEVAPLPRATTDPALSTAATKVSVLFQSVGALSSALPRASVAVTASWIVSPIDVAVSSPGVMPTHFTAVTDVVSTESGRILAFIECVYDKIETSPAPADMIPAPQRHALLIRP